MRRFGQMAMVILAAFMLALAFGPAGAAEAKAKASARMADVPPIYIMRGGLNIFSTGMDVLAKELTDKGYPAISDSLHGLAACRWRRSSRPTRSIPIRSSSSATPTAPILPC